ncbi:hypothetical protein [Streptomyces pseudovenezuelae]|uniref:Uncharacterized protein n=1 Tax=Streptomyces pseudovenezuelae TaxID=67350 RepID=A0ABT6LD91_9ACTN|nr:hypothetical protein [Streptomyces pseudovenezuelae]MDH6214276.1 hypothetical protein [Streptomyces pseudovenezuelae]
MTVRIRSLLTSGPIMVSLNSGRTVRLSPGRWSAELRDAELADNAKVDRLSRRGDIELEQSGEEPEASAAQEAPAAQEDTGAAKGPRARKRTDSAG